MIKLWALIMPVMLVGALTFGCGGSSTKTVKIPGGGEVSSSNKVPDSFPKDFPVYGGASVQGSLSGSSNGITGTTVTWQSGDSLSKVSDFYASKFTDGPWKSSANGTAGDTAYWTGGNSDGSKEMYLLVSSANGKTQIIATVGDNTNTSSGSKTSTSSGNSSKTVAPDSPDSGGTSAQKSATSQPLPAEATLAKDFPTDRVPFPGGARVTSSSSFSGAGTKTFIIEFYVKDKPDAVSSYFDTELPKHGWANAFSSQSNGEYVATFTSSDPNAASGAGVTVTASASDTAGYTKVDLTVSTSG